MSYFNLLLTLETSRTQLRAVPLPARETEVAAWLSERRQPEHFAADAACEEFALKESWPPIRHEGVAAQVHLRVLCAAQLCRAMVQQPFPHGVTRRQALQALLLDYWRSRVAQWHGQGEDTAHCDGAETKRRDLAGLGSGPSKEPGDPLN